MHHIPNKWDYNDMDKLFVYFTVEVVRVINRRKSDIRAQRRYFGGMRKSLIRHDSIVCSNVVVPILRHHALHFRRHRISSRRGLVSTVSRDLPLANAA